MGIGRSALVVAAGLIAVTSASLARADAPPAALFTATESASAPAVGLMQSARVTPFGPSPAPRVVLFPVMRVVRPTDIPPPKPTKGLALVFDW